MVWALALLACRCRPSGDSGAPTDTFADTGADRKVWREINAFGPCALADDGLVTCWSSGQWGAISLGLLLDHAPSGARVRSITADNPIWGPHADDGTPVVLYNEEDTNEYTVPERVGLAEDVSGLCARDGAEILCWHVFNSPFPADREYVALGGSLYAHAAVSADGGVWSSEFSAILGEWQLPEGARAIDVAPAEGGACVLLEGGELTCFGPAEGWFDDPPYSRVEGARNSVCAQHALTHEVICRDGSVFDWGPLRDLAVFDGRGIYRLVDVGTPDERWEQVGHRVGEPPHVCAITETNAVRCSGWLYDFPDLQAALPAGDE